MNIVIKGGVKLGEQNVLIAKLNLICAEYGLKLEYDLE